MSIPSESTGIPATGAVVVAEPAAAAGPRTPPAGGTGTLAAEQVDLWKLATVVAALGAMVMVSHHFGIESEAFTRLMLVSLGAFVVHYFLPLRFRLTFFLGVSLATLVLVLGSASAAWLAGLGLALVALCHVPVPFGWRIAALALAAVGLTLARGGWIPSSVPAAVWPILGSMFMFRMVVYLYDLRHDRKAASPVASLSYFFLLPNVCFPLFPVVDFTAYRRHYYDTDRHRIYQVGVQWIFRGLMQLLLYRVIYQNLVTDPAGVTNVAALVQYLTWPFLLYLRVSGQFHIVIGILRLFGFNLPETHHAYFLASSFTDFWRRINIYWKDFMMKVFYYPAYFALRRRGETFALVASTTMVFVVTWVLHSYQWFWIRGAFLMSWTDVLFWTILAALVVVNAVAEWKRGRRRALGRKSLSWRQSLSTAMATVGMFGFISVLWSLWSTDSLEVWLSLWSAGARLPEQASEWRRLLVLAIPLGIGVVALGKSRAWLARETPPSHTGTAVVVVGVSAILVAVSTSAVYARLGRAGDFVSAVRWGGLNQADIAGLERGYYENLMGVDRFNGELWALYMNRPVDWERGLVEAGLARETDSGLPYELLPSAEGRFKGVTLRTNSWGMHDREYAREKPGGCSRIALIGASHAMGSGVTREETFEALIEQRLNARDGGGTAPCYELLNFAVYGYNPLVQLTVFERQVAGFEPDAVLYVGHPEDTRRVVGYLVHRLREGKPVPLPGLEEILRDAGVDASTPPHLLQARLNASGERLLSLVYQQLAEGTRRRGMRAAFVLLPMVPHLTYTTDVEREVELAREAGLTVFDLSGVFEGTDRHSLWVAEWDAHPNAEAHRLIAERLHGLMQEEGSFLRAAQP